MLLIIDMTLFGICPEQEDIILVVCKECGRVVKAAAFLRHCGQSFIILHLFRVKNKDYPNVKTFCQFLNFNREPIQGCYFDSNFLTNYTFQLELNCHAEITVCTLQS